MNPMSDLNEFLRARLDMAERAAAAGSYVLEAPPGWRPGEPFDADRMLAEVEAKRRILDRHVPRNPGDKNPVCAECGGAEWKPGIGHNGLDPYPWVVPWPCPTVRLLALPFADHPDYRDDWRP